MQRVSSIILKGTAIRHKSTSIAPPETISTPTNALPPSDGALPGWATNSYQLELENAINLDEINLHDIPERIGYLKELGLDYGWGPTAVMEFLYEHVHVYSGLPWWGTIITTTVLVRLIFLKLYINSADNAGRMNAVSHLIKPLQAKMTEASARKDTQDVMKVRAEIQRIHGRAGVKMWRSFAPMLQIFTGYGTFIILRAMSALPVPGLEDGGTLWIQNLAIPDPYFVLPLATAGVMHLALRVCAPYFAVRQQ
jgi:YidC/Oxa1 family membrane protein insertase